jgi:RsiW-degrading membrane proteinase PrsW (M82 family)
MGYMQRLFPKAVLRSEMLLTFFWAMACMAPLVVLENLAYAAVLTRSSLEAQGGRQHSTAALTWGYKLLSALVRAYLLAAFFEELSKYVALRRLRWARHVTDPRALATYGLCAGAAFGTVEDLFIYAFAYGIDNTLARAFLSVPLHCMTGLLMGLSLAEDHFLHPGSRPWARVLAAPVLLHGTFDVVNFLLDGVCGEAALAAEVLIVLGGFAWARARLLGLLRLHPVEHDLVGLLARAASGDKLAIAEARALQDEDGALGPLARVASCNRGLAGEAASGRARAGSNDGYATDLDFSSSTFASSVGGEDAEADADADALETGGEAAAAAEKEQPAECEVPLVGPSRKAIALTGLVGCSLTAGMLCFLYLVPP